MTAGKEALCRILFLQTYLSCSEAKLNLIFVSAVSTSQLC